MPEAIFPTIRTMEIWLVMGRNTGKEMVAVLVSRLELEFQISKLEKIKTKLSVRE